jgi:NAD dependent epimerase/dehydratase family enzyme
VLKSRRVVPGRLLKAGFTFQYPTWKEAAVLLCDRARGRSLTPPAPSPR